MDMVARCCSAVGFCWCHSDNALKTNIPTKHQTITIKMFGKEANYTLSILLTLIVLSSDVQLNPGLSADFSPEQTPTSELTKVRRRAADLLEWTILHVAIAQQSFNPPVSPVFHPEGTRTVGV